jgi:predicted RNase H-like HicB family nuclease
MRQVVIYPGEDGYWVAECPSLPGCISQGKTREEATQNVKEAIQGYIAPLQEDGLPNPVVQPGASAATELARGEGPSSSGSPRQSICKP